MADARLNIGVSADAKTASATFKELAADIKSVGKESVAVTEGVAKVDAALAKLSKAPDTPMALARATAKAKLEIDELRATLDKTPASAEKMKAISAALAQADQAIQKTIERAGKLGEAQEEVKQKMGLTAKGAESLGNSFGSLDGIMGKMADSSSAASQSIAKVGFTVMAAGTAFEFGYSAGEKFRKGMVDLGVTMPDLSDKVGAIVVAMESMARGYKESELVESAAMARARQIIALREAQAKAENALISAQRASGLVWKDANAERDAVVAKLNAAELALARTAKSEAEWTAAIKVNAEELMKLRKEAEEHGIALDKVAPRTAAAAREAEGYATAVRGAADANREMVGTLDNVAAALAMGEREILRAAAAYDVLAAATARRRESEAAAANISTPVVGEFKAIHDAAVGAAAAAGKFGTDLDNVARQVVAAGGTLTVGTQIWLTVKEAIDGATEAVIRHQVELGKLREEQTKSLDATKGWTDYVMALKDGYDSGVTSLGSYIQQLIAFKAQLTQMFAGATGDAKEALTAMQDLIEGLMQTAGGRDPGTGNRQLDDLNRALAKAKERKK